jgi:hypothetical protein
MNNGKSVDSQILQSRLQAITTAVQEAATFSQGDVLAILALLRQLELLHREIRDDIFQKHLPDNRQALYGLLRDIETEGGWPYIERMRIQQFLTNMEKEAVEANGENTLNHDSPYEWS